MDVGKVDVVQVDLTRCGGFTEAMKIASLAADRGIPVVNHGFTTYLNVAAALHFLASIPNALIMEYCVEPCEISRNLAKNRSASRTATPSCLRSPAWGSSPIPRSSKSTWCGIDRPQAARSGDRDEVGAPPPSAKAAGPPAQAKRLAAPSDCRARARPAHPWGRAGHRPPAGSPAQAQC